MSRDSATHTPSSHLNPRLLFLATLAVAGCGGSSVERHPVSGTAVFAGKPVPHGVVLFEPDPARGRKGPQGRAPIVQGKFDTRQGQHVISGPVLATVWAYDGVPAEDSPQGRLLRSPWTLPLDLPEGASSHQLDIPAE